MEPPDRSPRRERGTAGREERRMDRWEGGMAGAVEVAPPARRRPTSAGREPSADDSRSGEESSSRGPNPPP
jgi:hypothetical protein